MKRKIFSLLFAAVLGLRVVFVSVATVASASVGVTIFYFLVGYFAEKGLDALIDSSPYTLEYKFELLTALRDFCKEKNIDPNSDDFGEFLTFAMLDAPDNSTGQYSDAYGEDWADLHASVYPYMSKLSTIYQMAWVDVQQWIIDRYNDDTVGFDDNGNVYLPIAGLKTELLKENNTLNPKNRTMHKYSWRELSDTQPNYLGNYLARAVGKDGNFFDDISFVDGIYIQPYVIMGDVKDTTGKSYRGDYYTPYQYRLYCEKTEAPSDIDYDFEYHWKFDALHYQIDDGERLDIQTNELGVYYDDYQFVNLGFWRSGSNNCIVSVHFYDELIKAKNSPYASNASVYIGSIPNTYYNGIFLDFLLSSDTSICLNTRNILSYFHGSDISKIASVTNKTLSDFQSAFPDDYISDYGLLFSNSPFSTTYTFDITRLPDNATVTISGDSVYDYSITDNSTGDTSTIYNYVTNNYNYPESSGGNTSGGGGNNGGDIITGGITVGGHVDVGGKVDINVNINGGGNGGTNGNIGDYVGDNSDIDTNINDYLALVPKVSKNFIDYMKDLFSWLPKEVYGLLVLCLILCVVRLVLALRGR